MTAFSLQDVAGDCLLQETPYPVVAPRTVDMLAMVVQYARIEGMKVMPLGSGSSFADNFRLASDNVVAIMTYRLSGVQQMSPGVTRVLSGTPVERIMPGGAAGGRKTVGGLLAGSAPGRSADAVVLASHLVAVEFVNAEAKLVRVLASNLVDAGDPGLANMFLGSQGRLGLITAIEIARSKAWPVGREGSEVPVTSVSAHDSCLRRTDIAGILDPDDVFGW